MYIFIKSSNTFRDGKYSSVWSQNGNFPKYYLQTIVVMICNVKKMFRNYFPELDPYPSD